MKHIKITRLFGLTALASTAFIGCNGDLSDIDNPTDEAAVYGKADHSSLNLPNVIGTADYPLAANRVYVLTLSQLQNAAVAGLPASSPFRQAVTYLSSHYAQASFDSAMDDVNSEATAKVNTVLTGLADALHIPSLTFAVDANTTALDPTHLAYFFFGTASNASQWRIQLGTVWTEQANSPALTHGIYNYVLKNIANPNHGQPVPTAEQVCDVTFQNAVKNPNGKTAKVKFYGAPNATAEKWLTQSNFTRAQANARCIAGNTTWYRLPGGWASSAEVMEKSPTSAACVNLTATCTDPCEIVNIHSAKYAVNVRKGPGTGYTAVKALLHGSRTGIEKQCVNSGGATWFYSSAMGGWIYDGPWVAFHINDFCNNVPTMCPSH